MFDIHRGREKQPWNTTDDGSTTATVTKAASTGKWHGITDIFYYTDKPLATLRVQDGTTNILVIGLPDTTGGTRLEGHYALALPIECSLNAAINADIDGLVSCGITIIGYTC